MSLAKDGLGQHGAEFPSNNGIEDVDSKHTTRHVSGSPNDDGPAPRRSREPPALIKSWSREERRRRETHLVRKIDFRLIPMIILMYIMNYLDRNNIASARLAGLEDELHLHGDQYQVRSSIKKLEWY